MEKNFSRYTKTSLSKRYILHFVQDCKKDNFLFKLFFCLIFAYDTHLCYKTSFLFFKKIFRNHLPKALIAKHFFAQENELLFK